LSGSIFERERLRPATTPTQVVAVPQRPIERAAPVRRADPLAPQMGARPTPPSATSELASLAAALSGFTPTLNAAAEGYFRGVRQEDQQNAEADATAMSLRQEQIRTWAEAVRQDPSLADRSPFYRQTFEERLARQSVLRRGNELHAEYWGSSLAGSADPAAIQGWLQERMRDTLDAFRDSPGQRAAAAEEVRNQALSLVRTHQQVAARNLVAQNEDSISAAATGAFDTAALRSGNSRVNDAAFNVPPELQRIYERVARDTGIPAAVLIAQGSHESGGFSPEVLTGRRRGSRGEIGLAQVLPSTAANPGHGIAPVTEQQLLDPEQAIRFQAQYLRARGAAAGVTDWNDPQQAMRGLAAYNGTGEQAQGYARTVMNLAQAGRGASSGPAGSGGGGSAVSLAASLQEIEQNARAQGVDGRRINQLLTQATAAAMVRHGRVDFAALGDLPRPDGTPGFGATAEGRLALENARNQVLSRQVQQENLAYTRYQRARAVQGDALAASVAETLIGQLTRNETPNLTPEQLRTAARVNPALIQTISQLATTIRGVGQVENTQDVALLEVAVNTGQASVADVMAAVNFTLRDPATIRRMIEKAQENASTDSIFRNQAVIQIIRETQEAAAGAFEGTGVLRNYGIGVAVGNAMREEAAAFRQRNPQASQVEIIQHLRSRQRELIQSFNNDVNLPAYERRAADPQAPDPRGPSNSPAAAAAEDARITVQPSPAVNTSRVRVFGSIGALDEAFQAFRQNPAATSGPGLIIQRWIREGNIRNIDTFYEAQKRLLAGQGRR